MLFFFFRIALCANGFPTRLPVTPPDNDFTDEEIKPSQCGRCHSTDWLFIFLQTIRDQIIKSSSYCVQTDNCRLLANEGHAYCDEQNEGTAEQDILYNWTVVYVLRNINPQLHQIAIIGISFFWKCAWHKSISWSAALISTRYYTMKGLTTVEWILNKRCASGINRASNNFTSPLRNKWVIKKGNESPWRPSAKKKSQVMAPHICI